MDERLRFLPFPLLVSSFIFINTQQFQNNYLYFSALKSVLFSKSKINVHLSTKDIKLLNASISNHHKTNKKLTISYFSRLFVFCVFALKYVLYICYVTIYKETRARDFVYMYVLYHYEKFALFVQ